MKIWKSVAVVTALAGLVAMGAAYAQEEGEAKPHPAANFTPKAKLSPELAKMVEECAGSPAVTHGGQTLDLCMEWNGYLWDGSTWVKKPATR